MTLSLCRHGGLLYAVPGSAWLSEQHFDLLTDLGSKNGFSYHQQFPETEMVDMIQLTRKKKREHTLGLVSGKL